MNAEALTKCEFQQFAQYCRFSPSVVSVCARENNHKRTYALESFIHRGENSTMMTKAMARKCAKAPPNNKYTVMSVGEVVKTRASDADEAKNRRKCSSVTTSDDDVSLALE